MEIECPHCHGVCESECEVSEGQHVLCPYCHVKFTYGESQEDVDRREAVDARSKTVLAVCPYCGFAESVDEQFSGHVGVCSECRGEFTIVPNARGIPFQQQSTRPVRSHKRNSFVSANGVLGFLLGFVLGILGVLLAVLIDKRKLLRASLYGLVANFIIGTIVVVFVSSEIGRKGASAASALDQDEGLRAKKAYESIFENSVRTLRCE